MSTWNDDISLQLFDLKRQNRELEAKIQDQEEELDEQAGTIQQLEQVNLDPNTVSGTQMVFFVSSETIYVFFPFHIEVDLGYWYEPEILDFEVLWFYLYLPLEIVSPEISK